MMCILEIMPEDHAWVVALLEDRWGSTTILSRGRVHQADGLPGYILWDKDMRMGLITYHIDGGSCEIVTLDSLAEGKGIGTALIEALHDRAVDLACDRLWVITTNDNLPALRFYQKQGFRLTALYPGVVDESRRLKPSIPLAGYADIPIRDEIQLGIRL
jgi:GNAT superfamily N-acetyltransferase